MQYHSPTSFDAAVQLAQDATGVTRFLAGGTDVLVQMRAGMVTPDVMIDVKKIPGVKDCVRQEDGRWVIGIAVSGAELGANADLVADWPGVVEGMELVGSTQVQGRATLVGNLCNGSPAADSVPGLVAAGAIVRVSGPNGNREVPIENIPAGPGKTTLTKGELITAIELPARGDAGGDCYLRFIPRTEMDIAVVGCAVNLVLEGDKITSARIALGAVAPTIVVVPEAAHAIVGTALDDAALEKMVTAVRAACRPISDKRGTAEFRTHVAGVLARRAAETALRRAKGETA